MENVVRLTMPKVYVEGSNSGR